MIQEAYVQGISTRSVDSLVQALGMEGISKSQVSRLCGEIDERVGAFLSRPIEGEWPYLWLDATYVKARRDPVTRSARSRISQAWRSASGVRVAPYADRRAARPTAAPGRSRQTSAPASGTTW